MARSQRIPARFRRSRQASFEALGILPRPVRLRFDVALAPSAGKRVLVLDISYRPVDIIPWQRAIVLALLEKVDVIEQYEDVAIRTGRDTFAMPAVIRVRKFVTPEMQRAALTRANILTRCCRLGGLCSFLMAPRQTAPSSFHFPLSPHPLSLPLSHWTPLPSQRQVQVRVLRLFQAVDGGPRDPSVQGWGVGLGQPGRGVCKVQSAQGMQERRGPRLVPPSGG